MWSAAVLEPELHGRRMPARASPVASRKHYAEQRIMPRSLPIRWAAGLLVLEARHNPAC
jgi:hypothetical protein